MGHHKKRIDLIKTLLAGSNISSMGSRYSDVLSEFNEVHNSSRISNVRKKRLIQILHATRGLDTSLSILVWLYTKKADSNSLGSYLHDLVHLRKFNHTTRDHFQRIIVDKRNLFMHKAGAYPISDSEVKVILSEIQQCLSMSL
jgi:hypothetical protein